MAWIVGENNKVTNDAFIDIPSKPFVNDSPNKFWRITTGVNKGRPYTGLMIERPVYNPPGSLPPCYIGDTPVIAIYIGNTTVTALL